MNDINWDDLPDDENPLWKPEKSGDALNGKLVDFSWQEGRGGKTPVLIVDDGEAQRTWWAGQRDAKAKLKKARPQVGDEVTVVFTGELDTGAPSKMKLFDVAVVRSDGTEEAF
jgi:hypothetical protein